jgi:hypothetical protein
MAAESLEFLQCWARRAGVSSVVEPFIHGTTFHSPPRGREGKSLRFSDVYDIDKWRTWSERKKYPPLVRWEEFLERAPRNLILVNIHYTRVCRIAEKNMTTRQTCPLPTSLLDLVKTLEVNGFRVVREKCFNFSSSTTMSMSNFRKQVFGSHSRINSTVLFGEWRGFSFVNRIKVHSSGCQSAKIKPSPSKHLIRDAESYARKHLNSSYVAVILRIEKVRKKPPGYSLCFRETLKSWRKMVRETGISTTFLSTDIGKFGSKSLRQHHFNVIEEFFPSFFDTIYGNQLTIEQWERTFEEMSTEAGYVGVLQKAIASRADCVLLAGGGSFQSHLLRLYRERHVDECVYIVGNCSAELHS